MLKKTVYPKIEEKLNKIAASLDQQGFSPTQLTLAGLILNFLAGLFYATGHLFVGGMILVIASLADLFDGPLARVSNRTSKFGAFLDSTVDRYSDFFIFGGLATLFARESQGLLFVLTMGVILGSSITSYAKARAENLIPHCNVGIFTRAERIILLALATLIWPLLPFAMFVLFLGTNATALRRIHYTHRMLQELEPKKSEAEKP